MRSMALPGSYRDAHSAKLAAGLHRLGRVGEALNKGAELAHAGVFLIERDKRHALVKMRDRYFVAVGILREDAVVGFDGGGVTASAIVDLGLVVVGIS